MNTRKEISLVENPTAHQSQRQGHSRRSSGHHLLARGGQGHAGGRLQTG